MISNKRSLFRLIDEVRGMDAYRRSSAKPKELLAFGDYEFASQELFFDAQRLLYNSPHFVTYGVSCLEEWPQTIRIYLSPIQDYPGVALAKHKEELDEIYRREEQKEQKMQQNKKRKHVFSSAEPVETQESERGVEKEEEKETDNDDDCNDKEEDDKEEDDDDADYNNGNSGSGKSSSSGDDDVQEEEEDEEYQESVTKKRKKSAPEFASNDYIAPKTSIKKRNDDDDDEYNNDDDDEYNNDTDVSALAAPSTTIVPAMLTANSFPSLAALTSSTFPSLTTRYSEPSVTSDWNRKNGEIKYMWPHRASDGSLNAFLVHFVGSDRVADVVLAYPDVLHLNEKGYQQLTREVPDRYAFDTFSDLNFLCQRFRNTNVTFWQLLAMTADEVWGDHVTDARRAAHAKKQTQFFQNHIACLWHVPRRGANVFLVHVKPNACELQWNADEFEWLAHGFALFNDARLHERARDLAATTSSRTYPWKTGDEALRFVEMQQEVENRTVTLSYSKKKTISMLAQEKARFGPLRASTDATSVKK